MTTRKIETWYDLKRFIVDELTGDQLGQPVEILAGGELVTVNEVTLGDDGDLTLEGEFYD